MTKTTIIGLVLCGTIGCAGTPTATSKPSKPTSTPHSYATAVATTPTPAAGPFVPVTLAHGQGVIVPADQARDFSFFFEGAAADHWTPEPGQVRALERALGSHLRTLTPTMDNRVTDKLTQFSAATADHYRRQYVGIVRDGKQWVFANFFCFAEDEEAVQDWTRTPVEMLDGGDCYFTIEFEPATGSFARLQINGSA